MKMIVDFRRPLGIVLTAIVALLTFALPSDEALARGGGRRLRWGYRPPAGDPLANLFLVANPWAAMSGAGIPRRNLGPARLNMGGAFGSQQSSGGSLPGRTTKFTGSASQASRTNAGRLSGGGFSVSSFTPRSSNPEPVEEFAYPPYYHHDNDDWHHGYWGGGLWGWSGWDEKLGVLSFPRWGIGPWYYASGYGRYVNSFVGDDAGLKAYATVIEVEIDESLRGQGHETGDSATPEQPAEQSPKRTETLDEAVGREAFEAAREAFRNRDYPLALQKTDDSLRNLLHDPAVHEFRGLVLFAQGEYRQAAAVIYDVLSVSPGWDWTTLSSLYPDQEEYTRQLRALEAYRKGNPDEAGPAFMVAYHYATCGHYAIAVRHLRNVIRLAPEDNLVPHLMTLLEDAANNFASDSSSTTTDASEDSTEEQAVVLDATKLVGVWKNARAPDVRIELTLKEDGQFVWNVEEAGHREHFEGQYRVSRNWLLFNCDEGTMIGVGTTRSLGGGFNFRLLENAPIEAGLDFAP